MKKALIMVLSFDEGYYRSLAYTSKATWDTIELPGIETVFYFGHEGAKSKLEYNAAKKNLFTGTGEGLTAIGYKNLSAFEWALKNVEFDYLIRVNASTYVNKRLVHEFIQGLPDNNLYMGVGAPYNYKGKEFTYAWGPHYTLSRDVVESIVNCNWLWNHGLMDDVALGLLMLDMGYSINNKGPMASIDIKPHSKSEEYHVISYNCDGSGGTVTDFSEIGKMKLPFIRIKTDWDRSKDLSLMNMLFNTIEK